MVDVFPHSRTQFKDVSPGNSGTGALSGQAVCFLCMALLLPKFVVQYGLWSCSDSTSILPRRMKGASLELLGTTHNSPACIPLVAVSALHGYISLVGRPGNSLFQWPCVQLKGSFLIKKWEYNNDWEISYLCSSKPLKQNVREPW